MPWIQTLLLLGRSHHCQLAFVDSQATKNDVLQVGIGEETPFDHGASACFCSIPGGTFEHGVRDDGGNTETYFPFTSTRASSATQLFGNSWQHTTASCSCGDARQRRPKHYGDTNSIAADNWPASCFIGSRQIFTGDDSCDPGTGGTLLTITAFGIAITG